MEDEREKGKNIKTDRWSDFVVVELRRQKLLRILWKKLEQKFVLCVCWLLRLKFRLCKHVCDSKTNKYDWKVEERREKIQKKISFSQLSKVKWWPVASKQTEQAKSQENDEKILFFLFRIVFLQGKEKR